MLKLLYAMLYSKRMGEVRQFYSKILEVAPFEDDEGFLSFRVGGALLGIKRQSERRERPGCQTVILECEDLERMYATCRLANATITKPISTESWGKNFAIRDPDGNKVEFVQSN